jgi:hypothetical protein
MKAKHKYILTLSTLALFLISVFIGYFISTAVVTKAPLPEGGGCPNITVHLILNVKSIYAIICMEDATLKIKNALGQLVVILINV